MTSLEAVRDDWLASQKSEQTSTTYRQVIDDWIGWCATRQVDVWSARRRDVDIYRQWVTSPHRPGGAVGQVTLAKILATLASFYRYAMLDVDPSPVDRSPMDRVKRPRIANVSHRQSLNIDEARALLAVAVGSGPRDAALVHLLLSTGIRVSEACAADTTDLGWTADGERALTLTRKGGIRTEITILPDYWAAIDHYLSERPSGPAGALLQTVRGRLSRQEAYRIVVRLATQVAPHKRIGPHSLRHTAATLLLDDGVPLQEVQGMLGHSDSRTTIRYDRNQASRGRVASRTLGGLLAEPSRREAP